MEDDDEFYDLLAEVESLRDSSQESLIRTAANLDLLDDSDDSIIDQSEDRPSTPMTCVTSPEMETSQCGLTHKYHESTKPSAQTAVKSSTKERNGFSPSANDALASKLRRSDTSVVEKIENVFEQIADALLNGNELSFVLLKRRNQSNVTRLVPSPTKSPFDTAAVKRICFPGKTAEEAWRFTVVLRILELIHEALLNGVVLSKRDIYYRDPALFGKQAAVDRYIDDIACTFGVQRSQLNVTAVAKGLIAGAITICRRDGSVFSAKQDRDGVLVPSMRDILSVDMTAVKWIMVVEKEATFRSIAASNLWDTIASTGIMVTGKGYPDIATRALLHLLSTPSPQNGFASPPIYGLVDFDPDGLAILSIYKHGSVALTHENAELRVPQMQWLGLRREDWRIDGADLHASQGLLTLTSRDRRTAMKTVERFVTSDENKDEMDLRGALQDMLMLNLKAELQLLDAVPGGMTELLMSRLRGL